jgi:hypothetical protein
VVSETKVARYEQEEQARVVRGEERGDVAEAQVERGGAGRSGLVEAVHEGLVV